MDASQELEVHPSHDIWALGLMAYEAIVQRPTLTMMADCFDCAFGRQKYPWELPSAEQPRAWRHSRLRALLLPCLARDAAQRPSASRLLERLQRMGQSTTMAAPDQV